MRNSIALRSNLVRWTWKSRFSKQRKTFRFRCFSGEYRCSADENPFELIFGEKFLYENYDEKRFRISPSSFLRANKTTAEELVRLTLQQADLNDETILLDIGSAIGTFSILAAEKVKKVYSIDPSLSSIDDAKFNAELNRTKQNIEWISGFPEGNLHRVLKKISDLHSNSSRIVVIVNPSRYSLSKSKRRVFQREEKTALGSMKIYWQIDN